MNIEVQFEFSRFRLIARYLPVPALATLLPMLSFPSLAADEAILEQRDAARVMDSAVMYYHQKTVERRLAEAVCYLDPKVEDSMRCSWIWSEAAADSFQLKQKVNRRAKKWCKEAGGRNCVEFWRNGRLRFEGLSPEQAQLLESVLARIPEYDSDAGPLPEGVGVSRPFAEWLPGARDHWERIRRKNRGRNFHYAICTSGSGATASFAMQGGGVFIENVRTLCILKCKAIADLYSVEGDCHVVYEDGKFASAAAEKAVMQ